MLDPVAVVAGVGVGVDVDVIVIVGAPPTLPTPLASTDTALIRVAFTKPLTLFSARSMLGEGNGEIAAPDVSDPAAAIVGVGVMA